MAIFNSAIHYTVPCTTAVYLSGTGQVDGILKLWGAVAISVSNFKKLEHKLSVPRNSAVAGKVFPKTEWSEPVNVVWDVTNTLNIWVANSLTKHTI